MNSINSWLESFKCSIITNVLYVKLVCLLSSDALQFVEHTLEFLSSIYSHLLTYAVKIDFLVIIAILEFQVSYEDQELAGIIHCS